MLKGAPWTGNKHILMFQLYDGSFCCSDYMFGIEGFWVRVYGLPPKLMVLCITKCISNHICPFHATWFKL